MAKGDIIGVTIRSDGWSADVTIEGYAGEQGNVTYEYGMGTDNDPTNALMVLTVTSQGYDATGTLGTIVRTVYGTETVRLPYPDNANLDETDSTTSMVVRVALSESIYDDDDAAGSGADIVITIAEGWCKLTDTGLSPNAMYDAQTITANNSTLDYPMGLGKWDCVAGVMAADRVTGDFSVAVLPVAGFGVACVKLDAVGQTSSHNPGTQTVTIPETAAYTGSGIHRYYYKATIPLAGFTDGELIDLRFRVFPKVGDLDSVYDTDDYTAEAEEITNRAKVTILCDKGSIGDVYAVVDSVGGGTPTSSTSLSTATSNPFATWAAAKDATPSPNIIYFTAGTHKLVGATSLARATDEWVRSMPHPNTSKANVILQTEDNAKYDCKRTSYEDVTVQAAGAGTHRLNGENTNFLRFRGCTFDINGQALPTSNLAYITLGAYLHDCDGDMANNTWKMVNMQSAISAYAMEGCKFTADGNGPTSAVTSMVGCHLDGSWLLTNEARISSTPDDDGYIIANNKFMDYPRDGTSLGRAVVEGGKEYDVVIGAAYINNVIEATVEPANTMTFAGSMATGSSVNNIIFFNNTFVGERFNGPYNAEGSLSGLVTSMFCAGNIADARNFKNDTYPVEDGGRVGQWSASYGVNFKHEIYYKTTEEGLKGEFDGLNVVNPASQMTFVDNASLRGDGTGNGDYHLVSGDTAVDQIAAPLIPFDIEGIARTTPGAAGAYEFVASGGGGDGDSRRDTRRRLRYA